MISLTSIDPSTVNTNTHAIQQDNPIMHEKDSNCDECIKMHERYYPLLDQCHKNKEILNLNVNTYAYKTIHQRILKQIYQ